MAASQDAVAGAALPTTSTARALSEEENKPVELSTLDATRDVAPALQTQPGTTSTSATHQTPAAAAEAKSTAAPHDTLLRTETERLGPATETDGPITQTTTVSAGPVLLISLMLTTGARHPYKIDEKYLRNRKVTAQNAAREFDPKELSGYQLKELIWTDWRSEWEPRPSNPGRIRLIIMGRMIEDKGILKDLPFNLTSTNVVHMTVKPADIVDDDETANAKGTSKTVRQRESEEQGAGCRCVIM